MLLVGVHDVDADAPSADAGDQRAQGGRGASAATDHLAQVVGVDVDLDGAPAPDGHHVHPDVLNLVLRAVGEDRIALVTDSSRATGLGDGIFEGVKVRGGEARTLDGRSLAGSILTMDAAVRFVVRHAGWSITAAARSAATTPARVLGLESQTGSIRPGLAADLVVLDPHLIVRSVYRQGVQVS